MSTTEYPPAVAKSPRPSKHADVVIGQARAIEADASFAQAPGTSAAMFVATGLLLAAGIIAAVWAIIRLIAHA